MEILGKVSDHLISCGAMPSTRQKICGARQDSFPHHVPHRYNLFCILSIAYRNKAFILLHGQYNSFTS